MKRVKKVFVASVLVCSTLLVACGAKNLESYYKKGGAFIDSQISSMMETNGKGCAGINIEFTGNEVIYVMKLTIPSNADTLKKEFEENDSLASDIKNAFKNDSKISPTAVTFRFVNMSGETISSVTK